MSPRAKVRGEAGYTPNEMDFCACGATFQFDVRDQKRGRFCGQCGQPEGKRRSWHERTGKGYANLLPHEWAERLSGDSPGPGATDDGSEPVGVGEVVQGLTETLRHESDGS